MNIDMKATCEVLASIEKRFNDPKKIGPANSYQCFCVLETVANDLLKFVETWKPTYHKSMIEDFLKKE